MTNPAITTQQAAAALDASARRAELVIRVLPSVLLVVSLVLTFGFWDLGPADVPQVWIGSAIAAALLFLIDRSRSGPTASRVALFGCFIVAAAWLVSLSPIFGILAFSGYLLAFEFFPSRWAFTGVAATAVVVACSQLGGVPWKTDVSLYAYAALIVVNVALGTLMSYVGLQTERRNQQQRQMLRELEAAYAQLSAQLAENERLQEALFSHARASGIQEERQRVAREIHDTLAQALAGIVTQLQAAEQARQDEARWRRHVGNAADLARTSLAEARRSVHALDPVPLETMDLYEAITSAAEQWTRLHGPKVEITLTGHARPLHGDIEATLLRTVQEALANVGKHAAANRVGLTLSFMDDVVSLDVRDDGIGFDAAQIPEPSEVGGFGLAAMRQRVQRVAGTLDIESEPGVGTALSVRVPAIVREEVQLERIDVRR